MEKKKKQNSTKILRAHTLLHFHLKTSNVFDIKAIKSFNNLMLEFTLKYSKNILKFII